MDERLPPPAPAHVERADPMPSVRRLMEITGVLLVIGAAAIQLGAIISAIDDEFSESIGDFFSSVSVYQLLLAPVLILAVLIGVAPRLFASVAGAAAPTRPTVVAGAAAVIAATSVTFSIGATITAMSRTRDGLDPGEWVLALGIAFVATAALVVCSAAILGLRPDLVPRKSSPRPGAEH